MFKNSENTESSGKIWNKRSKSSKINMDHLTTLVRRYLQYLHCWKKTSLCLLVPNWGTHSTNVFSSLCDNALLDSGVCTLLEALPQNESLTHLSLMHTGMGDQAALELAENLQKHSGLQELNVAYNNIGDSAALALVDACREHPNIHTLQ